MNRSVRLMLFAVAAVCLVGCTTAGMSGVSGDWQLTRLRLGGVDQTVVPGTTLTVSPGGAASGSGGVNRYTVSFAIASDGSITWSDDFASTKMMGYGPLGDQERRYFMALTATGTAALSNGQLELRSRDGQTMLGFTRP
ncbi:MAG TPA: META domain-containing protein [bacterium]|nr:META domain-containing protein [bacterium]